MPARLTVSIVALSAVTACEPAEFTREDIGDGCAQYRSRAGVVTSVLCTDDAGCVRYMQPDGALLRTICPADGGCESITEPDAASLLKC